MDELDIADSKAAFTLIHGLSGQLPQTPDVLQALKVLHDTVLELEAWKKLRDPAVLHANLLAGRPAKLSPSSLLHLVGAGECSNAGGCKKKSAEHLLLSEVAMPGASIPEPLNKAKTSNLKDGEYEAIKLWLSSEEGQEAMRSSLSDVMIPSDQPEEKFRIDPEVWRRAIGPRKR